VQMTYGTHYDRQQLTVLVAVVVHVACWCLLLVETSMDFGCPLVPGGLEDLLEHPSTIMGWYYWNSLIATKHPVQ
jgi:hypothetical protein